MDSLKPLRGLITALWIVMLGLGLSIKYYDSMVPANTFQINQLLIANTLPPIFGYIGIVALVACVFGSAALWWGHMTGKWVFLFFTVLMFVSHYKLTAGNSLDSILGELIDIICGAILGLVFYSPLKDYMCKIKVIKLEYLLATLSVFFLLLSLFFYLIMT